MSWSFLGHSPPGSTLEAEEEEVCWHVPAVELLKTEEKEVFWHVPAVQLLETEEKEVFWHVPAVCCPSRPSKGDSGVPAPQDSAGCVGAEPGSGPSPCFPAHDSAVALVPLTGCPPAFLADVAFPVGVK